MQAAADACSQVRAVDALERQTVPPTLPPPRPLPLLPPLLQPTCMRVVITPPAAAAVTASAAASASGAPAPPAVDWHGVVDDAVAAVVRRGAAEGGGAAAVVVAVAAYNSPEQVVLSGHVAGVDAVVKHLQAAHAGKFRKTVKLPVSAPFHCSLMKSVREPLQGELKAWLSGAAAPLCVPLHSTAQLGFQTVEPADVARVLLDGVLAPVRWWPTVVGMTQSGPPDHRIDSLWELGCGDTLTKLSARALTAARAASSGSAGTPAAAAVGTAADVAAVVSAWGR